MTYNHGGKTVRRWFATRKLAEAHVREQSEARSLVGDRWLTMPPQARADALAAYQRAQKGGYTLAQACDAMEAVGASGQMPLGELIDAATAARAGLGLRPSSVSNVAHYWRFLKSELGDVPIGTITPEMIEKPMATRDWSPLQCVAYRAKAHTLFAWAVKRGLLAQNPVARVERPRVEAKPPEILTPSEARRFLDLARTERPRVLPCVAVMLFAGIRPTEAERLRWEDVRLASGRIVVESAASKVRQRRLVTIEPALAAWLELTPKENRKGTLAGRAHAWHMERLRAAFGHRHADVLRHSFVSYHVAHFRDIPRTAMEAGHSVDILMRHYRELTTPEAAAEFWAIRPLSAHQHDNGEHAKHRDADCQVKPEADQR